MIKSWSDVEKYKNSENGWFLYLEKDITSMRELYIKYCKIIYEKFSMNVINHLTLSAMGFAIWRTLLDDNV